MSDDRTKAEALRIAKEYLEKMGWKYPPEQIGKIARKILDALENPHDHS